MLKSVQALLLWPMLLAPAITLGQVPYPPPALAAAPSVEAAAAAVGASKPEFSSYLLLDIPEISLAGPVSASVSSEIPGTTQLILLRQFPEAASPPRSAPKRGRAPAPSKPTSPGAQAVSTAMPLSPPTVLVAAAQIEPGGVARLDGKFNFARNERFTLLVFAQGRWFFTAREMKLAKPAQRPEP